jgi:hypothetical protein
VDGGTLLETPSFCGVRSRSLFKSSDHNIAIVYILFSILYSTHSKRMLICY